MVVRMELATLPCLQLIDMAHPMHRILYKYYGANMWLSLDNHFLRSPFADGEFVCASACHCILNSFIQCNDETHYTQLRQICTFFLTVSLLRLPSSLSHYYYQFVSCFYAIRM